MPGPHAVPDPAPAPEAPRPHRVTASRLRDASRCERRLWLRLRHGHLAAPESDFDQRLHERARAHEREAMDAFRELTGPVHRHDSPFEPAAEETRRLLASRDGAVYQPAFVSLDRARTAVPDFAWWDGDTLVLREVRTFVNPGGLEATRLPLTHAASVAAETFEGVTIRLEAVNGRHEVLPVKPLRPGEYEQLVARAVRVMARPDEPDTLLGHSACEHCPFYSHCWTRATAERRVEILPSVTRANRPALADLGIHRIEDLAAADPAALRAGPLAARADDLVLEARAHAERRALWRRPHGLPSGRPRVWFDLEGDSSADVPVPIYLWGLGVDAEAGFEPEAIVAGTGPDADREAWTRFLARAAAVFEARPGAVWVHYDQYERVWLERYIERHGAPDDLAAKLTGSLFDLCAALRRSVVLPVPSYSIKRVAALLGFSWSHPEMGSQWSVAQYEKARATADPAERERLFESLRRYNADDLGALRHLWGWMEREGPHA
jgi:predicted RecB family nuclease